jgi:hypothetical protein
MFQVVLLVVVPVGRVDLVEAPPPLPANPIYAPKVWRAEKSAILPLRFPRQMKLDSEVLDSG